MSGYLTRLAQRARGEAPAVHANARLPFAAAPEPLAELPAGRIEAQPTPPQAGEDERSAPTRESPMPPAARVTPRSAPPEIASPAPIERAPASIAVIDAAAPREEIRASESAAPREPARVTVVAARTHSLKEEPPRAATVAAAPRLPRAATVVPPLPPMPRPAARKSEPAARASAPETPPPDVHIHIGRIELTAASEPAPARRPGKAAKAPMSLDEYLQRRGGRSP